MNKYKEMGIKLTPQRIAILDYLDGNGAHPSAEDIYRAVSEKHPTMSFATVYNTLETLREKGKLIELTIDFDKKRFDPETRPHHHLICRKCKKIVDINEEYSLEIPEDKTGGFQVTGNHIEFYGFCMNCT